MKNRTLKHRDLFERAINLDSYNKAQQFDTLTSIGSIYEFSDRPDKAEQAIKFYSRSVALAKEEGNKGLEVNTLLKIGEILAGTARAWRSS